MLIGYARVSTADQTLALQQDALQEAGCDKVFTDTASGSKQERAGLEDALSHVRKGDTLVVWRLDRLGRSLRHLIDTITDLSQRGIGFRSITENIDTTSSGGKLVFHIFGALAEFERDIIRERTNAGLQAARARGRLGGRPKALNSSKRWQWHKPYMLTRATPLRTFAKPSISHAQPYIVMSGISQRVRRT
jgi:DNA invertase Pin-like site-specific DNA recombinase